MRFTNRPIRRGRTLIQERSLFALMFISTLWVAFAESGKPGALPVTEDPAWNESMRKAIEDPAVQKRAVEHFHGLNVLPVITPPKPPLQPATGPGGADYLHKAVRETQQGEGG